MSRFSTAPCFTFGTPFTERTAEWIKIARDFTLKYYSQINLPDGTNLEQAINYNKSNMNLAIETIRMSGQESIEWLKPAMKNATATLRYIASTLRNGSHHGALTRMGQDDRSEEQLLRNALTYFPDEDMARIMNHVYGDGTASQPSFTSCAFPYSGYFVMRTGWKKEDAYSFFKASRRPRGHYRNDNTAIHFICAYGRDLLIDEGSSTYGDLEINPLMVSSFSKNTIQIDGSGQDLKQIGKGTRGDETTSESPIHNRWHTSNRFDFAEGFYHGGYENPAIMVRHERQIFFLRKQQIWIVTDRMRGESAKMPREESHQYSQTWNFPEDFEEKQVAVDPAAKSIRTIDPMGANVSLHHFGSFTLDYKKYYGQENPLRGWVRVTGVKPLKAVSIDANWQGKGEQVLVTLIIPANKGEERVKSLNPINITPDGSTCGFTLVLKEGTSVSYSAALDIADLKMDALKVQSSSLLLVTPPGEPTGGIILEGRKSLLNGNDLPLPKPDFEFTMRNQKMEDVNPILYPSPLPK